MRAHSTGSEPDVRVPRGRAVFTSMGRVTVNRSAAIPQTVDPTPCTDRAASWKPPVLVIPGDGLVGLNGAKLKNGVAVRTSITCGWNFNPDATTGIEVAPPSPDTEKVEARMFAPVTVLVRTTAAFAWKWPSLRTSLTVVVVPGWHAVMKSLYPPTGVGRDPPPVPLSRTKLAGGVDSKSKMVMTSPGAFASSVTTTPLTPPPNQVWRLSTLKSISVA